MRPLPRPLAVLALCLALAPATPAQATAAAGKPRPRNVLFYLIDTCRADALSVYGNPNKTTPFLEKLAEKSLVFEACYSQAAWTKPSMAALLSSRYPSEVGIHSMFQRLGGAVTTFPEVLQRNGYRTAGFSSNPLMGRLSNYTQGFDKFLESQRVNRADPIRFASGAAAKLNGYVFDWLDAQQQAERRDAPGFLYVHSVDPHEEYEAAPEYLEQFADPAKMAGYRRDWKKLLRTRPIVPGNHLVKWNFDKAGIDPGPFVAYGRRLYDADLLANDVQIEKLWERVKKEWGEDTIVIVTSDHGEEFYEHGGTSHVYTLYEEMVRVPLIIHAPGLLPAGKRIKEPVRSIDIYPTLLDLLGMKPPEGVRGRSLSGMVRSPKTWKAEPVFAERTEDVMGRRAGSGMGVAMMVRMGRWRYTLNLKPPEKQERARHELFDLSVDPGEKNNVAAQHADLVAKFEQKVMEWSARNHGLQVASEHDELADEIDPETLARLRELGYVGGVESAAAAKEAARTLSLPLLVRAVLEADDTWLLHAIGPDDEKAGPRRRRFGEHALLDSAIVKGEQRDALLGVVSYGVGASNAAFSPTFGVRAAYRGHTADLFLCTTSRQLTVYLDAVGRYGDGAEPIITLALSATALERATSVFTGAGL